MARGNAIVLCRSPTPRCQNFAKRIRNERQDGYTHSFHLEGGWGRCVEERGDDDLLVVGSKSSLLSQNREEARVALR